MHTDEPDKAMEALRMKVHSLERQLCAVQRHIQMQGDVSKLAVSLDGRLEGIAQECERRVSDVRLQVSAVSDDVACLKKEMSGKASTDEVRALSEEVSHLKEDEQSLGDCISRVENKTAEAERALRDEIQSKIEKLDALMKMVPIDPLNGIIAQLTSEYGGNIHVKKVIECTASSYSGSARNVVDLGTDSFFGSDMEPNQWIRYDFKDRRVSPTSYSIRSADHSFPKSWVFEVSNDGSEGSWETVDCRNDNGDLASPHVTRNFTLSTVPHGDFRFVRLRLTGKTHSGNNFLQITSLEVFGTLSS